MMEVCKLGITDGITSNGKKFSKKNYRMELVSEATSRVKFSKKN